ncbi:hypothetical protein JZ751_020839 [Albula glossodonta]|uniref:Uncharacterized protein n=1 Tax=Albula glossodonta TaxID=121402 RepID=A0A8T2PIU4_9TELE|nr:hypothetical protein JZ751_020839 [Albula glossodonta]
MGNPQLRVFRPNFFLTLVRPGKELPPDTLQFRIPMDPDFSIIKAVWDYLERQKKVRQPAYGKTAA